MQNWMEPREPMLDLKRVIIKSPAFLTQRDIMHRVCELDTNNEKLRNSTCNVCPVFYGREGERVTDQNKDKSAKSVIVV